MARDASGRPIRSTGVDIDITAQKAAEQILVASAAVLGSFSMASRRSSGKPT